MKNVLILLGIALLLCACNSQAPLQSTMKTDHWGPPSWGKPGTEIRIHAQQGCPISSQDFDSAMKEAPCQAGPVIKSGAACRQAGNEVTWKLKGNVTYHIKFIGNNPMEVPNPNIYKYPVNDPQNNSPGISCGADNPGSDYNCRATIRNDVSKEKVYEYQVGLGDCPPLDPHIIIY